MNGSDDYVANVRLTNQKGEVLAEPGERCSKVPGSSLEWLLRDGLVSFQPTPKKGKG